MSRLPTLSTWRVVVDDALDGREQYQFKDRSLARRYARAITTEKAERGIASFRCYLMEIKEGRLGRERGVIVETYWPTLEGSPDGA